MLYEILTQRERKVMHHDRLKMYTSDVIPAWIRRQRHKVLPQCQRPDPSVPEPTEQGPDALQPLFTDHSSDNDLDEAGLDPPRPPATKGKRRVAARRRRQAALRLHQEGVRTSGLEKNSRGSPTRRTLKGREIRPPVR